MIPNWEITVYFYRGLLVLLLQLGCLPDLPAVMLAMQNEGGSVLII